MVLEWSRAETGVGATIAPSSQRENGSWAALARPAKAIRQAGIIAAWPRASSAVRSRVRWPSGASIASHSRATAKPVPPRVLRPRAVKALPVASWLRLWPMSRNEARVVISQNRNIHDRWLTRTMANIAERKRNITEKNSRRRSGSSWWWWTQSRM